MFQYQCLNPISKVGLDGFTNDYTKTEEIEKADAILVRSASMHEMKLPENIQAIARAGAGVNNIPLKDSLFIISTPIPGYLSRQSLPHSLISVHNSFLQNYIRYINLYKVLVHHHTAKPFQSLPCYEKSEIPVHLILSRFSAATKKQNPLQKCVSLSQIHPTVKYHPWL